MGWSRGEAGSEEGHWKSADGWEEERGGRRGCELEFVSLWIACSRLPSSLFLQDFFFPSRHYLLLALLPSPSPKAIEDESRPLNLWRVDYLFYPPWPSKRIEQRREVQRELFSNPALARLVLLSFHTPSTHNTRTRISPSHSSLNELKGSRSEGRGGGRREANGGGRERKSPAREQGTMDLSLAPFRWGGA